MGQTDLGVPHVNKPSHRVFDDILNRHADIDDVLVFGEHQPLMLMGLNLTDVDLFNYIDDWWIPMNPRQDHFILRRTETKHYAAFGLVNLINP